MARPSPVGPSEHRQLCFHSLTGRGRASAIRMRRPTQVDGSGAVVLCTPGAGLRAVPGADCARSTTTGRLAICRFSRHPVTRYVQAPHGRADRIVGGAELRVPAGEQPMENRMMVAARRDRATCLPPDWKGPHFR